MESQAIKVRKNVIGLGHDTENAAIFSTRFKFSPHCGLLDSKQPVDEYLVLLLEIPGVIRADVYEHAGLYDVHIKKVSAFDWSEVEPKIVDVLNYRQKVLSGEVQ